MTVVPWDANATVDKMVDITQNIRKSFPWVQLTMFHELVVPGLVQFVTTANTATWKAGAEPIPGPLTERLCALARQTGLWLVPGSMYEQDGDKLYNTAIVISPQRRDHRQIPQDVPLAALRKRHCRRRPVLRLRYPRCRALWTVHLL